ncbi:Rieske 2Fe-2S domain-containing protein [Streptomyces sp. GD-15H]|uniref:Rieske 2Fe-2S domain-containing protein n=1 Tax=Streptomyces sp. GD-15H TaxID=3129112 RepID=UPI00324DB8A7
MSTRSRVDLPEPGRPHEDERHGDEEVWAFHNVCRHRGARILDEERGSVGNIVCGYHHWTYGVDGTLIHAESQAPGFDPSCLA